MTLQIIFSGVSLVLCAFFFVYFHIYIRRRTSHENILANYRDEVNRLIADIDSATDRDAQLVEDRIATLRKTLDEADRRISLLSRDLERRRPGMELYTSLGTKQPPLSEPLRATAAASPVPVLTPPPVYVAPSPTVPPMEPPAEPPVRPLTERVADLSRQGISPELIAARLELSLSEVELALAVSRRIAPGGI
ncbi:MAG: hypothetical protein LBT39_08880 [Treponema sp.]|nr:hypothetical protein [Treponema sp.]